MLGGKLPTPVRPTCGAGTPISNSDLGVTTLDGVEDTIVLAVTGEIDMSTGQAFRDALDHAVERSHDVVVDLAGVSFMDSTGLNALIRGAQQAQRLAGTVRVRSPRPAVRRVLDITGAAQIIAIEAES